MVKMNDEVRITDSYPECFLTTGINKEVVRNKKPITDFS